MILNIVLLVIGVFAASTAVIMIKASVVHPVLLASLRLLVAAVVLTPTFLKKYHKHRDTYTIAHFRASILPALALAVHFVTWIVGARMAPTANASLIVNLVPVAMPFFLMALLNEHLTRREVLATALALCGVVLLTSADLNLSVQYFWGDLLCFVSMLFFAFYLVMGRKNRYFPSVWLYLIPLYYMAGLFCMIVALFFVNPLQSYPPREVLLVLGLGIIPTVIGHSLLNRAMKHLRSQIVSVVNMGQFVFAGAMAYGFFGEVPDWTFFVACALLVTGVWIAVSAGEADPQRET